MGRHFTRSELLFLLTRRSPSRGDLDDALEHLFEECASCREQLEHLVAGTEPPEEPALARPAEAIWARFKLIARAEATELLALSPAERHLRVSRAHTRFRNPVLVDLLVEESRRRATRDPHDAADLAECAHEVALRLSHAEVGEPIAMTCLTRANAYRANALRVLGHLRQAQAILEGALALFDAEGTGDPLVQAEFMELSASLARAQRRFIEAEGFLDIARALYEECREPTLRARTLVTQGTVLFEAGEPERALRVAEAALESIDPALDPWLYLCAAHNTADYLVELGRYDLAAAVIAEHRARYEQYGDRWINVRRLWIEAKIARGRGDRRVAEELLLDVRSKFLALGGGYDAALAGLDLASLYVEERRTEDVRRLAEEMVPVFMAEDIHREAAAAVMLLQEAARKDAVTLSMVAELAAYLRRVRGGPKEEVT